MVIQYIYLLGRKLNSMQSCKSIVTSVTHCIGMACMMSVLQEVKGLTKKYASLYFQ